MIDFYEINSSCIFFLSYNFFFKDITKSAFENKYSHTLYQRQPNQGLDALIEVDFQVYFTPNEQNLLLRYYTNQRIVKQIPFEIPVQRTGQIKKIPFNFLMVKMEQNSLSNSAKITFINGYDMQEFSTIESFSLKYNDKHLVGSQQRKELKTEFLTFIEILEVAFYKGSHLIQDSDNLSPFLYYTGFDSLKTVVACKNTNNPQRNVQNNPNLALTLQSCNNYQRVICQDKCDICLGFDCKVCIPGYELQGAMCVKCLNGYDPILKVCFEGVNIQEFQKTQIANLQATQLNLELKESYFLATFKFSIRGETYQDNNFFFYLNNVNGLNEMSVQCWDTDCLRQQKEIYFALMNKNPSFFIETLVVGNTGSFTITPTSLILRVREISSFDLSANYFKNFDCSLLGNYLFQKNLDDYYYGKCVSQCFPGFYPDYETFKCEKCPANCSRCLSAKICSACASSFVLYQSQCV